MVHIDRIYTRSGDHGETSLGNGDRVSKLHPRIIAGGAIDETNCAIGVAIAAGGIDDVAELLRSIQQLLFDVGADLCVPLPGTDPDPLPRRTDQAHVDQLESLIDQFTARLKPLSSFILPGGTAAAASLHLARAVCRRAELEVLKLHTIEPVNPMIAVVLNRLSDLLFVLARIANQDGQLDVLWSPGRGLK